MPKSSSHDQIYLYERALQGDLGLIGWGYRDFFHLQRWQEKFPLVALTETRYTFWDQIIDGYPIINPLALRDYSAKDHAVISYYHSPWVNDYVKRVGKMPVLSPLPLQHMVRKIATKGRETSKPISPLPIKHWRRLNGQISDDLNDYTALHGKQTLGTRQNYRRNLKLFGSYRWYDCVASICQAIKPQRDDSRRVVLIGNSLCAGGAERQLVNLALGFAEHGWEVYSLSVMAGDNAPHYVDLLERRGIPMHHVLEGLAEPSAKSTHDLLALLSPEVRLALWHLPIMLTLRVAAAIRYFQKIKPSLVIAYLDWPSTIAGLAAALAGVPNVVISGRNYAPTFFPYFFGGLLEEFHHVYQILATLPNVHFTNNSTPAAASYAKWLNLPKSRITFVPNCLTHEFMSSPSIKKVKGLRTKLGIEPHQRVVLGIFRLSPEKRPEKFLDVVAQLVKKDSDICALICGDGSMREALHERVAKLRLQKHVKFAGIVSEVREMMKLSDILLHTSAFEGMPNVILEAQAQGLPVVCTRSGGVTDCLAPELLPYSFSKNDWGGVTSAALLLLENRALRKKLGAAAQKYVRREFSLSHLVERNMTIANLAKAGRKPQSKKRHAA